MNPTKPLTLASSKLPAFLLVVGASLLISLALLGLEFAINSPEFLRYILIATLPLSLMVALALLSLRPRTLAGAVVLAVFLSTATCVPMESLAFILSMWSLLGTNIFQPAYLPKLVVFLFCWSFVVAVFAMLTALAIVVSRKLLIQIDAQKRRIVMGVFSFLAVGFTAVVVLGGPKTGLRADIHETSSPGVPEMYSAQLINRSKWPVRVNYCSFSDDTSSHFEKLAYIVERWDVATKQWRTVFRDNGPDFCKPRGLGMVETKRTSKLLWPGQSIPTEGVYAGRDGFNIGDRIRFAVYTEKEKQGSIPLRTPEFVAR